MILEELKPHPPYSIHPPGLHLALVEAVLSDNPDAAADAMRNHARVFYENLMRLEREYRERVDMEKKLDLSSLSQNFGSNPVL